jgi:hypothetical protein
MPRLHMDNHAPRDHQLSLWALRMLDTEKVIPQIKLHVNPQVSLTQSHEFPNAITRSEGTCVTAY